MPPKGTPRKPAPPKAPLKVATKKAKGLTPLSVYLLAYNIASALAWGTVLVRLIAHMAGDTSMWTIKGALGYQSAFQTAVARASTGYSDFGDFTKWVQTAALLEIVHSGLGLVGLGTTVAQVFSRIMLVWGVCDRYPLITTSPIYVTMVFAWSFTEIVRYSFYAAGLLDVRVPVTEWLRYNAFYVLYPLGAGSEAWLIASSAKFAGAEYGALGHYGTLAMVAVWPPALFFLMSHMHAQRRKHMQPASVKKTETKVKIANAADTPARSTRSRKAL